KSLTRLLADIIEAPRLTGIYNKKENLKASSFFKPNNIAATMVAPDRLIPGKRARAWASPIMKACLIDKSLSPFFPTFFRIIHKNIPVTSKEQPTKNVY